jgi:hypothetical protein
MKNATAARKPPSGAPNRDLDATSDPKPQQNLRPPPVHAGDMPKTCSNCQHYKPVKSHQWRGTCHNGISGRLTTDAGETCRYGFYPSVERFPLRAGPGGVR